ncbi:DinB family protein [Shimia abyssi]|uniref:Putative damage-inducible protein DinB n=1 Tax=Shimia abyssi TaxID=1662395 RepID=A0A2P8F668_9RHOB|nr:DinB family protein [Shimia abyssi]PSL17201.1 putative damage-inducible protein DinB [Shimia abyssi]
MISSDYCRVMARYNDWQNTSLVTAADELSDAARWQNRGAFFGSIAETFNHLYWADALMLARILGNERPQDSITHSLAKPKKWNEFKILRLERNVEVQNWADGLSDQDLTGSTAWIPPGGTKRVQMPTALCAVQLFNHQTHHRGQIHAMLTAAGVEPKPTDLSAMP